MITDEILKNFVYWQSTRYDINKVWIKNGWKYATDGRICVRIPTADINDSEGKYPDGDELFDSNKFLLCDVPLITPIASGKCSVCNGRGKLHKACPNCCGDGVFECPTCHAETLKCETCCGSGRSNEIIMCNDCDGTGIDFGHFAVKDINFNGKYIHKLNRLFTNCVMIGLPLESNKPAKIKFEGGECALMPMAKQ